MQVSGAKVVIIGAGNVGSTFALDRFLRISIDPLKSACG